MDAKEPLEQASASQSTIRPAVFRDLDRAMNIICSCTQDMIERGIYQWDEIYPDAATLRRDIESGQLHVMESNGTIMGLITLNEDQPPEYGDVNWRLSGQVLVVHRLAIDPPCQNQGLARKLMQFSHSYAKAEGYHAIRLDTFIDNLFAVRLYYNLGYRNAGTVTFPKGTFFCFEKAVDRRSRSRE